jgi:predicted esterase
VSEASHASALRRAGPSGGAARAGLVLAHGRGGTAEDILSLGTALGLGDLALAAPQAPGNSWWPTSFLAPHTRMEAPLEAALAAMDGAVAALEAEGLARASIAVAGFSQGACLALEWAARRGGPLAGAFGFSGGLVGTGDAGGPGLEALYGHGEKRFDYSARLDGIPVWISVHETDPHIPLARVARSAEVFAGAGAQVARHTAPGAGHTVFAEDIAALQAALAFA